MWIPFQMVPQSASAGSSSMLAVLATFLNSDHKYVNLKILTKVGQVGCYWQLLSAFLDMWVGQGPHSGLCQVHT